MLAQPEQLLSVNAAVVTALAILTGLLLHLYIRYTANHWKRMGVPCISPHPLFGNIKDIALFRVLHIYGYQKIYYHFAGQPYAGIFQLRTPSLMLRDPEVIKTFLVKDFAHFHDRGILCDETVDPMSTTLVNLPGQRWKNLRSKLTPSFSAGKLKTMIPLLDECVADLIRILDAAADSGNEIEMREAVAKLTTDVIGSCAFGIHFKALCDPNSKFREMGRRVYEPNYTRTLTHILRVFFPQVLSLLRIRTVSKEVADFFTSLVSETIRYRESSGSVRNDFMQLLLQLRQNDMKDVNRNDTPVDKEDIVKLNDQMLTAQVFVFFVAGFETTSSTMSFCMLELAYNKEVQRRAQEEIDQVLAANNGVLDYDALQKMDYLERVIHETLRKYPPVPGLVRVCTRPYQITDTLRLERGAQVLIPTFSIQRDPEIWPNPEQFDPDRFTEEGSAGRHPFAYLPFGEGPRICIGMRFAMLEMKHGLARVLQKFNLDLSPQMKMPVEFDRKGFVLSASDPGLLLKFQRRTTEAQIETNLQGPCVSPS